MSLVSSCGRGRVACALLSSVLLALHISVAAGSGSVKGRVVDRETGDPLPGANIVVVGTSIGASTDLEGKFVIPNVPEGTQTLRVSYIGYLAVTRSVTILANSPLEENFRLVAQAITGETVTVTAQAQGQNAAINQQLSSNTIANIVSADRLKEVPDVNAAESIGRLPGVAINRSGGEANTVTIRGLEPKYSLVTVNGVRLPSSGDDRNTSLLSSVLGNQANPSGYRFGGNDRSVDLSLVSNSILDGIELKKAITPDMDADVLGGTVDLRLKEAPSDFHMLLSAQGGYNNLQDYYGNYAFIASASDRFLDNSLGTILTVNVDSYDRSADKLAASYRGFGAAASQLTSFNVREEKVSRGRSGANLVLDFTIPDGKLTGNVLYNRLKSDATYRINSFQITDGRHYYDLEDRHGTTDLFTGSLGIKQDYGWMSFDAGISKTGSENRAPDERGYHFSQETGSVYDFSTYQVDTTTTPQMIPQYARIDTNQTKFADAYSFDTKRYEYQTTLQLNIQVPFRIGESLSGYVKGGGKLRELTRRNDEDVFGISGLQYGGGLNQLTALTRTMSILYPDEWDYLRDSAYIRNTGWLPVTRFLYDYSRSNFLNGDYPLGLAINLDEMNKVMEGMKQTPSAYQKYYIQSLGRDYDGTERYQSYYLMSELNIGNYVTVIPGVRWEKDYAIYHGERYRAVVVGGNTQSPPLDYTPVTSERGNDFWLPMAHLIVKPLDWMKVRLAFTKSLTRPDFRLYAPITYINSDQTQIVAANYDLKPSRATNYDASVSVFDNTVGLFSVSGFYKQMDDLIFQTTYPILPSQGIGPPPGSDIPASWVGGTANPTIYSYPMNNRTPAYIRGIELEWQTHFWYLPSLLKGLVLNVNYTRLNSTVDIHFYTKHDSVIRQVPRIVRSTAVDTSRTSRVPGQPTSLFNITVGYDYEGFSVRLSYLFQSDRVGGVDMNNSALDSYTADYKRWDLTLQQTISSWGVQFFANLSNLNSRPDETLLRYQYFHPTFQEYYGFTMDIGVRFKL
jgi:TonB-dependent receptor